MTAAEKRMSADEFLQWRLHQEGTWELVDGVPIQKFYNGPDMMAGGSWAHALVASNIVAALRPRLRGGPCVPVGSDFAVRTRQQGVRQPDVLIECGKARNDDLEASEPRVIFEVLSPSTRGLDLVQKADEYRRIGSLLHLVLLEPNAAKARVWSREGADWRSESIEGLTGVILLPGVNVELPLSEAYEDVELQED